MTAPVNPVQQQNTVPANPVPTLDQEMEDQDNNSSDSDDSEVERLRDQLANVTNEMNEIRQLLDEAVALQARQASTNQNNIQEMRNLANTVTHGKEAGEILKPNPPELFDGTPVKLATFLTQCRAFMLYYPTQFSRDSAKVMYAAGRLKGTAAQWFQPVMEDYTNKPESELQPRTFMLYNSYTAFEKALKQAFGTINEKGQAEREIKAIRQTRSASEHGAKFLQLASKLPWDQDALMSLFFDSLKEQVQAELFKQKRPPTLVEYIGKAVEIDDYQFSWRTRKSRYNGKQNNQPRYDANQGRRRDNNSNTSYGTTPGPMEIGAIKKDKSKITCWNCGKKGHYESDCRNPNKTNQQYRPVPEPKRQVRSTNTKDDSPQTGIRTTNIRMTRSEYDRSGTGDQVFLTSNKSIKTKEEAEEGTNWTPKKEWKEYQMKKAASKEAWTTITEPEGWEPVPEPPTKPDNAGRRIAMVKTRKDDTPDTPDETMPDQPTTNRRPRDAINRNDLLASSNLQRQLDSIRLGETSEDVQVRLQRRKTTLKTLKGIRKTDEELWTGTYPETYDENGNRYWHSLRERYIHTAREHVRTIDMPEICVRAYHRDLAENPRHPELPFNPKDDVRTYPTHPEHDQISWMSCQTHSCKIHLQEKQAQDCFPVSLPAQPNNKPYSRQETLGYKVWHWYDSIGVANAKFDRELFKQQRAEDIDRPILAWREQIEDPGRKAESRYQHSLHLQNDEHDYESCDNPNDCGFNHIEHAKNDERRL
ncbi:hypothetical protein NM208_g9457 [Fusarium decemcellulare]|uniref:Uncharacterized protein n=1 Tax=Fusarium decemcellulare TaxID=57161 RepID=A0ACC1S1H6_9HYPO|nr:hypothetical protein NM208_g9457 [Fusarium decemcellulare]